MRKFYCDVCGKEMQPPSVGSGHFDFSAAALCPELEDICSVCAEIGASLNAHDLILDIWKNRATGRAIPAVSAPADEVCSVQVGQEPGQASTGLEPVLDVVPVLPGAEDSPVVSDNVMEAERPKQRRKRKQKEKPAEVLAEPDKTECVGGSDSNAAEKRAVLDRLWAYRQEHGVGSISALADICGVTPSLIRSMLRSERHSIGEWRAVGAALDAEFGPVVNPDVHEEVNS